MNNNLNRIKEIIREKLGDDFADLRVVDIHLRRDFDSDGHQVLLVDVVFAGEQRNVDAGILIGAVSKVRPALIENDEDAFPVFSFIAQREMGMLTRDAR